MQGHRDTHLQAPKDLVNEELHVVISELLAFHNVVQVCSHEMCHQVPENKSKHVDCEAIS